MFAILGLVSLFLLQSNGNSGDAGQLVQQGWQLWQQQHFDQAAQEFPAGDEGQSAPDGCVERPGLERIFALAGADEGEACV